jgi:HPt (histidine-containing phosphotransfer) domain-containing protein
MTALFTTQVPQLLTAAGEAAAQGDWPSVARAAHSLGGSCAQMGSRRMSDICHQVEVLAAGSSPMPILSLLDILKAEFGSFATWLDNRPNNSARPDDQ